MASADMCEHEWPGTGCEECKAEARERAQQTEQAAKRTAEGAAAARAGMGISDNPYVSGYSAPFTEAHDWQRGYDRAKQSEPAQVQDERNPTPDDYLAARSALESCDWSNVPLGTKAILGRVVDLLWLAAQARPAQTEQQPVAMPESWWQLIHDTIRNYRLTTIVDADGDGYELIDAMTAEGQPVSEGIEECTYLTDAIWNALLAAPVAQTEQEPWAYGWESRDKTRAQVDRTPHGGTWFPLYRQPVQITRSKGDT